MKKIDEGNRWMLCICSAKSDKYAQNPYFLSILKGIFSPIRIKIRITE